MVIHVFINYVQSLMTSFSSFHCNLTLETCGMFLDISKAFDRVWYDEFLINFKQNGVSRSLFQLITSFLSGRFQRVLLNGQASGWETIQAGVRQGLILGPLFFRIYINDLKNSLKSNMKLFANDTSLFLEFCDHLETANTLNNDLRKICEWVEQWAGCNKSYFIQVRYHTRGFKITYVKF